ncbi:MAG: deoxynucleoside kinase [Prevotellaceae bacterium]|jgi:deoxyadenosine/deoxycytidine kinase|nr:deoxynucleoside kinase [Prevotellaceae bacterium]
MHIAVAGNIGSGKTTLTGLLARHYNWQPKFEVEDNPYLFDFYDEMQRWSFNLQVYFLGKRFEGIVEIKNARETIIQDRTIYEDACIFALNLRNMGLMSSRDFDTYNELFNLMISLVTPPDLLIYLRSSVPTLVYQIQKRGRDYETGIRIDYLTRLNELYEAWIEKYTGRKLIIDVDTIKFSEAPEDLSAIIDKIDAQLYGLF